jgi:hypothetical protein
MSSKFYLGLIIVLILLILFVPYIMMRYGESFSTTTKCTVNPKLPGYLFCPGAESSGGNIGNQGGLANNTAALANYCDSLPNCAGFNTNGWIKTSIQPRNLWVNWTNDPNKGLYVKQKESFVPSVGKYGIPMTNPFSS